MVEITAVRRKAGQNGRLAAMAAAQDTTIEALIVEALKQAGSIIGAARMLEVNQNTVRHYMAKYGIELSTRTELRRIGA